MFLDELEREERWKQQEEEGDTCYTCGRPLRKRKYEYNGMLFCSAECREEIGDV